MGGSGTTGTQGGSRTAPRAPAPGNRPTYGLTITATAASGGGLRDYGVFHNESVFTVYMEMTHSPPAPPWTLQYALLRKPNPSSTLTLKKETSLRMEQNLLAPYPMNKENPEFPVDAVSKNLGRMVVVYGVINAEGKLENMRIIQSPNPLLNAPLIAALEKWSFRPAELNGEPVAVKALVGIPLSLPH
jgi:TonB family protein